MIGVSPATEAGSSISFPCHSLQTAPVDCAYWICPKVVMLQKPLVTELNLFNVDWIKGLGLRDFTGHAHSVVLP